MKCMFCGEEATVFGEYGPNCGTCYFTLRDFHRGTLKLSQMSMEQLLILERIYKLYTSNYAQTLKAIRAEIKSRR